MSAPYFSIAIPTKNRPDRLRQAIRSVLEQSFPDFELIVCDNSDPQEQVKTAAVVGEFNDRRIVYAQTNGRLSMPDNWEHAMSLPRGEYVGILTDRSVYHPHTLERAHREIGSTGVPLVGWFGEHYGRGPSGRDFRRRSSSGRAWQVESRRLLEYFLQGHPKHASKRLPKLMSAICKRSVIDEVRGSRLGRICPPVAPDYTSGYLMLAHTDRVVLVDEALFVSCGSGNGTSFRFRGALAERFVHDLGMGSWRDLVDRMPTRACFPSAMVLNDLMRVKESLPERFPGCEVNRIQYYLGCLSDYHRAARRGADQLFDDYDELIAGLARESRDVQEAVRTRNIYVHSATLLPPEGAGPAQPRADDDDEDKGDFPEFDSVFDAMKWGATQPLRASAASEDVLSMPRLVDVERARGKSKPRPVSMRSRTSDAEQ